ncbi:GMC oxidoreductase [Paraburkholderia antibiotica]|uniref:Cholesterol oxidase n=1 Tax=Paraburkholderia antibiotica TaxID=2728839 RepID=A0A7X9X1P0_9BURK|nr:GMC oxidoreductase [Paraburkholderia antibiotica]NML29803.1 GMC family oxidoreductase [Paraburkholderia antibiotica]
MSRREFLKRTALGLPAMAMGSMLSGPARAAGLLTNLKYQALVPEIYASIPKPPVYSQAIVIGSGFGGSIAALRLANAGIQTTVLERGSHWPNSTSRQIFATDVLPDGRGYWQRTSAKELNTLTYAFDYFNGVLDVTSCGTIDVWRGACVGGGSVVFTGVMIQPQQSYFETIFGDLVDWNDMNATYYPRVRTMLNLNPMPADIYNSGPFGHSRIWDQQSAKAGYVTTPTDSIFNWDVVRSELKGTSRPSAIIGESNLGNSNGAKFDLNQNYLKQAQATGKATVYACHEVTRIRFDGSRYTLDTNRYAPDGTVTDSYSLTCDYLFLAAGSMGSSELMVAARDRGDLPLLNEHVGEGWGTNGDSRVVRSFSPIASITQGSPCASMLHQPGALPTTLENWYTPAIPINLGIIGSLGMGFDMTNRGRFVYNAATGKAALQWPANGNDAVVAAARAVNNKIAAANNVVTGVPLFTADVDASFTAHPLGGLVLGKATDAYGRIAGYPRLYAIDGATIPGTTGAVNPSLTISALAERNIEKIIATDFAV